jgi:hypothetical protein
VTAATPPATAAAAVPPAIPGPVVTQPTAENTATTPVSSGAVTKVGNSYSGTNVSGPVTINGQPSSGSYAFGAAQTPTPAAPAGFAPASRVPATPLADAAIAANQRLNAAIEAAMVPIKNRAAAEIAAGQNATTTSVAGMREAGDTARLNTREAGDTSRTNIREAGDMTRNATNAEIARGRLGVEQADQGLRATAAGFQTAAAKRLEAAQVEMQSAKTPEALRAAQTKILALQGKEAQNRFTVVPGGQEIDPASGLARTLPARVIDNSSGQFVDGGGKPALPAGMVKQVGTSNGKPVYEDAKGNRHIGA